MHAKTLHEITKDLTATEKQASFVRVSVICDWGIVAVKNYNIPLLNRAAKNSVKQDSFQQIRKTSPESQSPRNYKPLKDDANSTSLSITKQRDSLGGQRSGSPVYSSSYVLKTSLSPRKSSHNGSSFSRGTTNPTPTVPLRPKTAASFSGGLSFTRGKPSESEPLFHPKMATNPPFVVFPKAKRFGGPMIIQPNSSHEDMMQEFFQEES